MEVLEVEVGHEELNGLLVHEVLADRAELLKVAEERRRGQRLLTRERERRLEERRLRLLDVERDELDGLERQLEEDAHAVENEPDDVDRLLVRLDLLDVLGLDGRDRGVGAVDERLRLGKVGLGRRLLARDARRVLLALALDLGDLVALLLGVGARDLQPLEHLVGLLGRDRELLVLLGEHELHRLDVVRALDELLEPELDAPLLVLQLLQLGLVHHLVRLDEREVALGRLEDLPPHLLHVLVADVHDHLVHVAHVHHQVVLGV